MWISKAEWERVIDRLERRVIDRLESLEDEIRMTASSDDRKVKAGRWIGERACIAEVVEALCEKAGIIYSSQRYISEK